MPAQSITLIISPFHVGQYKHRVGNGPDKILAWNLVQELEQLGIATLLDEIQPVDDYEGEIGRSFEVLRRTSRAVARARDRNSFPVVLSGNCMATVGVVCGLWIRDLGFVYFDAHDDMETPSTNTNGYLDAMGLSMLAGRAFEALWSTVPGSDRVNDFKLDKLVYCGLRATDQEEMLKGMGCTVIPGDARRKVDFAEELGQVLPRIQGVPAVVHLDLDVLDESVGKVNGYETPGGMFPDELLQCLGLVTKQVDPVSLTVCSFNPDLGSGYKISRIAVQAIMKLVKGMLEEGKIEKTL